MTFVSAEGLEVLKFIRVGGDLPEAQGKASVRLLASLPSEECGCPEELWSYHGLWLLIHMEDDGTGHIILYGVDNEFETSVPARDINDLRARAFQWVADNLTSE